MTPHALDLTVLILILLSTLAAAWSGIIREFFTLVGFGLGALAAWKLGPQLVPLTDGWVGVPVEGSGDPMPVFWGLLDAKMASRLISYGGVFLLIMISAIVLRVFVSRWIKDSGLTIIDRSFGALFGFARGYLLVFVVYAVSSYLVPAESMPDWVLESKTSAAMSGTLNWTEEHFDFKKFIEDRGKKIVLTFDKVGAKKDEEEKKDEAKPGESGLPPVGEKTDSPAPSYTPIPDSAPEETH